MYRKVLTEQRLWAAGDKYPELPSERVWEAIVKKLFQKEYKFDATFYGSLNEYSRKVAYFFHASLQGTGRDEHAAVDRCGNLAGRAFTRGCSPTGQCFTATSSPRPGGAGPSGPARRARPRLLHGLSFDKKARKPSDTLFEAAVAAMARGSSRRRSARRLEPAAGHRAR